MTIFKIRSITSVFTNDAFDTAFNSDTALADSLVVDPSAYLLATNQGIGARLGATGPWTVIVNGSVIGAQYGIQLLAGSLSSSTITIGLEGEVGSSGEGIRAERPIIFSNAGLLHGTAAIALYGSGTNTLTNSGTILSNFGPVAIVDHGSNADALTNSGKIFGDVDLGLGNDTFRNVGSVDGDVQLGNGNNTIANSGTILGNVFGGDGNDILRNSKNIEVSVNLGAGNNSVTNSGSVTGDFLSGGGNDTIENTGAFFGNVSLGGGNNRVTNYNWIEGDITAGAGNDTITNSKTMYAGSIILGDGVNTVFNSGSVWGHVLGGAGNDRVTNSKTIGGDVDLGNGINVLSNTGTIKGDVIGGSGNDTITTKIVDGDVILGDGTNNLTNVAGIGGKVIGGAGVDKFVNLGAAGDINLGDGDDKYTGGAVFSTLRDGNGSDTYVLGNTFYIATGNTGNDGIDTITGGSGLSVYDARDATTSLVINLDTVAHNWLPFPGSEPLRPANTATGADVAGASVDKIFGFEVAIGGSGNDRIYGSAVANDLLGMDGSDHLFGYQGADKLQGGGGVDVLVGGRGKDLLIGGPDGDFFSFSSITDSGVTKATRDVIADFQDGLDQIDVALIDANTKNGSADDGFVYVNGDSSVTPSAMFTGQPGELRSYWTVSGLIVEADVDGNRVADFSIELTDPTHAITLASADFFDIFPF